MLNLNEWSPSKSEERVIANGYQAFIRRHGRVGFDPLVSVTHKRQIKEPGARITHARKFHLETGDFRFRMRYLIGRTEIESAVIPLPIDIYHVVELGLLWRRLNVARLEHRLDECISFGAHLLLQRFGQL